jgi:hypothetical protein
MNPDTSDLDGQIQRIQASSGNKQVVYTCVLNDYSTVLPPIPALRGTFDFILFSDEERTVDGWTHLPFPSFDLDPRRSAKFCKVLPHRILSAYDASIWIDGNFELRDGLRDLFLNFVDETHDLALFRHRRRTCIYAEAIECIRWGKDDPQTIGSQMRQYRKSGHPRDWGLFMGGLLMRKHNSPRCGQVMENWWREISSHSVRDQLSLPVVLQRDGMAFTALPFSRLRACAAVRPHRKYHSYALNGRNLLNIRAWFAPLAFRLSNILNKIRNRSTYG